MKYAIKKNFLAIEPSLEGQTKYSNFLRGGFNGTVWKSGCNSWYLNKDNEVKKKKALWFMLFFNITLILFSLFSLMVYGIARFLDFGGIHITSDSKT